MPSEGTLFQIRKELFFNFKIVMLLAHVSAILVAINKRVSIGMPIMVSLGIHGQPKSMWHSLRGSTSHITISLSLPISNVARHCLSTFNFVLVIHTTWYGSRGDFTFNPIFFTASLDIALVQLLMSITKERICLRLTRVWKIFPLW